MLQPTDRRLLFDALAPPPGYQLDWTVGTSYTLDLLAMLAAPVAFAFSDWQDNEGRPTPDPLAMLKAVRQYADRMCLFCQAGRIHVPPAYQPLMASLESSVVEALAPRGGSFHPKIWFLRFVGDGNAVDASDVTYRFLCLSRNMTFDRAWDTMLCLEGPLKNRANAYSANHPLGEFVEALPAMSVRGLSRDWTKRIETLAYEIRRVDFDMPEHIDEIAFWPIGIDAAAPVDNDWPFPYSKRTLVISPFVSDTLLRELADASERIELVGRADQLELLSTETLADYCDTWILDDSAEPEPSEVEQSTSLVGLHAKIYVLDEGWNASVFTGSANATHAAFHRNVEFLTQLRGKKSKIGVAAVMGEANGSEDKKPTSGAANFSDMLQPFRSIEQSELIDETEKQFERLVDDLAKEIASALPVAACEPATLGEGFRLCLQASKRNRLQLLENVELTVRPASLAEPAVVSVDVLDEPWAVFESISMLSLTSFFVFTVTTAHPKKMAGDFILNLPIAGEPEGRREALLKHLLNDKDRVLRFMMLLLSDADASAFAELVSEGNQSGEAFQFSSMLDGHTLFESLMRCVDRDPSRLHQVADMISDLADSEEGRSLLPDDLDSIWQPIWAVAQRESGKAKKRGSSR